jgi:spore germination protein D
MKIAVKDTLISPEYKKEIEKIMTDPRFAGEFAKAINSQSKQLHMQLIKDPSYQKSIEEMLKSPELTKMYMDLTKTPEYRKQSMTVMHDAMQNPIFRLEVMNLLKTVVQEELQPKVEKKGGEQGGSGDQKQDGGGGEGEQGGGEGGQGGGQ